MPVFKAYLKVIRKNAGLLLMYLGIVLALAVMMNQFNAQRPQLGFSETQVPMAFFNDDSQADSTIVQGLRDYLQEHAKMVDVSDDPEAIRDALFFAEIAYVIRVPAGFADGFGQDETVRIERLSAPDSSASAYMDMRVNQYLNTARLFRIGMPTASDGTIVQLARENLRISTPVELESDVIRAGSYDNIVLFYNYLAYALLAMLILGITTCMLTFGNLDLKRRNLSSPLSIRSLNLQLIAGGLVFGLFSWGSLVLLSLALYGRDMLTQTGLFLVMNAFVYMLVGLSLSFLVGHLLKSRNAQAAVSNVLTLGMSFISGVFVPQDILGKTVLAIARFTPSYWFVKANVAIGSQVTLNGQTFQDVLFSVLIQMLFAIGLLCVSWIVILNRRQKAS